MNEQEPADQPQDASPPRRAWTAPLLEVIPAADTEASSIGPPTDGITGVS